MLRFCLSFLLLFSPCFLFFGNRYFADVPDQKDAVLAVEAAACAQLHRTMQLEDTMGWGAFRQAVAGYHKIAGRKRDVLTPIDLSRPSAEKRLFMFDMKRHRLLFSSVVSHGKNGGRVYATSFPNEYGSYKSSSGFYLMETTYQGKNGYSLIFNGLERGINDRVRERVIMMYGAAYADPSVVGKGGHLGCSFGYPAVLQKLTCLIIDVIEGGSVMYIYAETSDYLAHSSVFSGYRA